MCADLIIGNIYGTGNYLGMLCLSSIYEREIHEGQYMYELFIGQKSRSKTVTQLRYNTAQKLLLGP